MSDFERHAVARVIERATAAGVHVPDEMRDLCTFSASTGARLYAAAHPDEDPPGCCWGTVTRGLDACTCWEPVFDVEQAPPRPPRSAADVHARARMCTDCAFRKGSPERAVGFEEEALFDLVHRGDPFWCHDGMRRPVAWRHPQLGEIPGDPDDWKPSMVARVPYRADGSPGLLCAGWIQRRLRVEAE